MLSGKSSRQSEATALWRISGMGFELLGAVLGMMLIGWLVDRWQGSSPRWTTVGAIAGLIGGGVNFIRKALALNKAAAAKYRREHPPGSVAQRAAEDERGNDA